MNRFDLEDSMSAMQNVSEEIETLMHSVGDSAVRPTEDDILNMLIGMKALNDARYQRLWQTFEYLVKNGTITNKCCVTELNESPQGSPEITEKYQQ